LLGNIFLLGTVIWFFLRQKTDLLQTIKNTEDRLQRVEAEHQKIVENIKEVVFKTDSTGLWSFLNFSWIEVSGYSVQESISQSFFNFFQREDRASIEDSFQRLAIGKQDVFRQTAHGLQKNGQKIYLEIFASAQKNDSEEFSGILGILRKTADVLEESENKVSYQKSEFLAKTCELPKPIRYPATLLLIDNDTRFTFAFAKAIQGRVDRVLIVSEIIKALHQIRKHPEVNIVLINSHMPTLDIFSILEQIRSIPRNLKLQIAVLVNNADANDRILATGANACLEKSIGIEDLCIELENIIQKV